MLYHRIDRASFIANSRIFNALALTLDPCATHENAKCEKYYTKEQNGFLFSWSGERVFMNPPYGREIERWVKNAYRESDYYGTIIVGLLPARTDTAWFHSWVYGKARIGFIRGRLKFGDGKQSAPFPSMIAVWEWDLRSAAEQDDLILKYHRAMTSIQARGTR